MTPDSPKGPETASWEPLYGFCSAFAHSNESLAKALESIRRRVCAYGGNGRCDCKYGRDVTQNQRAGSEQTGCPELIEVIHRLLHRPESFAPELERLTAEVTQLRADMRIRQGALNDVLGHDRSQDTPTDYYRAVEDVAELRREVSRLREQLAAQQPADVVERAALWLFRAKTSRLMPDVLQRASRMWHHVLDQQDRDAWVSYAREMLADLGWGVSSSEVEAPQPQRELDVIKGEQLARIHRFVRDLKDSVPDVTGDPVQDAFNRGYAEADVLTGGALGALLNVRFNEVLDSPEFRAALDGTARDSAPSEASQHKVEVKPQGGGWWKAECAECDLANYTRRRFEAEDWKDQHEADTLRPAVGGVVPAGQVLLADEPGPAGLVVPPKVGGRPSGSKRLAPRTREALVENALSDVLTAQYGFLPLSVRYGAAKAAREIAEQWLDEFIVIGDAAQAARSEATPREFVCDQTGHTSIPCKRCEPVPAHILKDRAAHDALRATYGFMPRLRGCVERWPNCEEGAYNPSCCRFPKSCSCTVYDATEIRPEHLESPSPSLRKEGEDQ